MSDPIPTFRRFASNLAFGSRPFVSRLLRGKRTHRQLLLSAVLALSSVLIGLWLALGSGSFERSARVEMALEDELMVRELRERVVFADTVEEYEAYSAVSMASASLRFLRSAVEDRSECHWSAQHHIDRAQDVLDRLDDPLRPRGHFFACTPADLELVDRIVAEGISVPVVMYSSPLGARGSAAVIGSVAAGLLTILMLVIAPLWAGTSIAQETHENTLQPLVGTALTPRQLALGLLAGPLATVGILAAPLAVLVVLCAAFLGQPGLGIAALCVLTILTLLLALGSQLLGLGLGAQRSPGVVGVLLTAVLGGALMAGFVAAIELNGSRAGMVAVLPHAGAIRLLLDGLIPGAARELYSNSELYLAILVGSLGAVGLARLGLLAVERWISRSPRGLLRPLEALLGAVTLSILTAIALHHGPRGLSELLAVSAVFVTVPFLALLAARVPTGETPPALRRIPIAALLGELFIAVALHATACVGAARRVDFEHVLTAGSLHAAWAIAVAGLIVIRLTAAPSTVLTRLLLAVCGIAAFAEFAMGVAMSSSHRAGAGAMLLPLADASFVLGLVQAGLLVALPYAIVRSVRREGAAPLAAAPRQP